MANVTRIIEGDDRHIFISAKVEAEMVSAGGGQKEVKNEMEGLAKQWSRRRKHVFVHLSATGRATQGISSMLDITVS